MSTAKKLAPDNTTGRPSEEALRAALEQMEATIVQMNPDQSDVRDAGWQERKSAQTRMTLLAATVACLSEHGYAKTTTQLVAATAKISRGAMLHHYATKSDLIEAVIDYVLYRRMQLFFGEICKLSDKQREGVSSGVEIYWKWVQTAEYEAYLELSVASRTDTDLRKVFDTKARAADANSFSQLPVFFPEWGPVPEKTRRLAQDFIIVTLQGLHLDRRLMTDRDRRLAIRDLITRVVLMLRTPEA